MNNPISQSLDIGKDLEESKEVDANMAKKEEKKKKEIEEDDDDFDFDDEDSEPRPISSYLGMLFVLLVILAVCLWLFTSWKICFQF